MVGVAGVVDVAGVANVEVAASLRSAAASVSDPWAKGSRTRVELHDRLIGLSGRAFSWVRLTWKPGDGTLSSR